MMASHPEGRPTVVKMTGFVALAATTPRQEDDEAEGKYVAAVNEAWVER